MGAVAIFLHPVLAKNELSQNVCVANRVTGDLNGADPGCDKEDQRK